MEFLINPYIMGLVSLVSLTYAIWGHIKAKNSEKLLSEAKQKIVDVEKAVTSFEYLPSLTVSKVKSS